MTTPSPSPRRSISGNLLLLLMSFATIATVAAIAGFCTTKSWTLLPVIMIALVSATVSLVAFIGRMLADGDTADETAPAVAQRPRLTPAPPTLTAQP